MMLLERTVIYLIVLLEHSKAQWLFYGIGTLKSNRVI